MAFRGTVPARNINLDPDYIHMNLQKFIGLLKFGSMRGRDDVVLNYLKETQQKFEANHKCNSPIFFSPGFVRKSLRAMKDVVVRKIVNFVNSNCDGRFGVLLDTTTDLSIVNKCSIVIRYVMNDLTINERTVGFLTVDKASGQDIFNLLKETLYKIGLNIANVSNEKGVNAFIKEESPRNIHVWCVSHRFNLMIQDACKKIADLTQNVNDFAVCIKDSYKRLNEWKRILQAINKDFDGVNTSMRPQKAGNTRWWAKYKAIHSLVKNVFCFLAMFASLHNVCWCPDLQSSKKEMRQIHMEQLEYWSKYSNILKLFVLKKIMAQLHSTTVFFQTSGMQISEVIPEITVCYKYLNSLLENSNEALLALMSDGKRFLETLEVNLNLDGIKKLFKNRPNNDSLLNDDICTDTDIVQTYLIEFIQQLMKSIQHRFLDEFKTNEDFYKELTFIARFSEKQRKFFRC